MSVFKDIDALRIEGDVKYFTEKESDTVRIKVPTVHGKELLEITEIADSMRLIPLSYEPEAIIGTINKIIIKHNIYVLDRYKTKALKVFDFSGKYIVTVGKSGGGPEEYAEPTDFLVTEVDIKIYDQFKQRIM